VIEAAVCGDVEAMNTILQYYASYISSLSVKHGFDYHGPPCSWTDEYLRRRLETKLIVATLLFDPY